jgi:hypothetical protein
MKTLVIYFFQINGKFNIKIRLLFLFKDYNKLFNEDSNEILSFVEYIERLAILDHIFGNFI